MIIHQLDLDQVRGFRKAIFEFKPGFNLLVGENGTGKSTVLWALRVMLSHLLKDLLLSKQPVINFMERDVARDIATEWPFLNATLGLSFEENSIATSNRYLAQKNRHTYADAQAGNPREQVVNTPDRYEFVDINGLATKRPIKVGQPIAVYYSAHRSIATERASSKRRTVGGKELAYVEALLDRELNLREVADLWQKEVELEKSDNIPIRANVAIEQALPVFLEGFKNLRVEDGKERRIFVDKHGVRLDLMQVSDGERSLLAILMDLIRRLATANPSLQDPASEANAVVLIDELDLHLHPRWQRTIVQKLTETFPKCQFIATTHSPQIIGEVLAQNIILLERGKQPYNPNQSLGMDSNWVLEILMDTPERNVPTTKRLEHISDLIEDGEYEQASTEILDLQGQIPDDPELLKLQIRLDRMQILGDE